MATTATGAAVVPEPRILRIRMGLTQDELARALGVSRDTISRWERGRTKPHRVYLWRMQRMLQEMPPTPPSADEEE